MTPREIHTACLKMLASIPIYNLPGSICDAIREQRLTFADVAAVVQLLSEKVDETEKQLRATEKKLEAKREELQATKKRMRQALASK
jgi:energy-converting hydrogenase Eha subunit H